MIRLAALILFCLFAVPVARAGTIEQFTAVSATSAAPLVASIYRPGGPAPAGGWPVLYLLHGHDGDERSWPDLGNIGPTLDRLIASGAIPPLLVVMPRAGNSWYVNSLDIGGPADMESLLLGDLRIAVEARFPVRHDRGGRAIAGLSMGGFGALHLAFARPDLFIAVASLSGALWQNVPVEDLDKSADQLALIQDAAYFSRRDAATVTAGVVLVNDGPHFNGAFGTPFDARRFNKVNVFTALETIRQSQAPLPAVYLACGDDDGLELWRGTFALFETLRADGYTAQLRITDGAHDWSLWRTSVEGALTFIAGKWTAAP